MESNYERDQLRPTTELPPLPPLAGAGGPVVLPVEVVAPKSDLEERVKAIVAPPPAVVGELSGVYCECGLEMYRVRDLADGRTSYRCQCGKGVTF